MDDKTLKQIVMEFYRQHHPTQYTARVGTSFFDELAKEMSTELDQQLSEMPSSASGSFLDNATALTQARAAAIQTVLDQHLDRPGVKLEQSAETLTLTLEDALPSS